MIIVFLSTRAAVILSETPKNSEECEIERMKGSRNATAVDVSAILSLF